MRPAAELRAALRERDLEAQAEIIAKEHHLPLAALFTDSHVAEIVRARRAIWFDELEMLGSISAVARLWGVDRIAVRKARDECTVEIVGVLLDEIEEYSFRYVGRARLKFQITDNERTREFETYQAARAVWLECLEEAGVSSFRRTSESASAQQHQTGGV